MTLRWLQDGFRLLLVLFWRGLRANLILRHAFQDRQATS